ncbi:hypothetical protein D3C81_1264290 [compost metagenome]
MVTEAEQIQLQRLALHHPDIRNVADVQGSEVRLSCNGAQAGEFREVEFYEIIAVSMFVLEAFQNFRSILKNIFGSLVTQ